MHGTCMERERTLRFRKPVLGHVLKQVPRHVLRHVLEHVPKHVPDRQVLDRHVPDRQVLDRHVPEHMFARHVLCLEKKLTQHF